MLGFNCLISCCLSGPIITFPFAVHLSHATFNSQTSETGHKVYQVTTKYNPPCNTHINLFTYISPVSPKNIQPTIKMPLEESRHFLLSNTMTKKCKSLPEHHMLQLKYSCMERKGSWKKSKWQVYADSLHRDLYNAVGQGPACVIKCHWAI